MAKRPRLSEEERERREYARLAREERLGERYSSQSKTRRREVAAERTRQAQNLGPAPVTDEKAATRIAERDKSRYTREGARRYQAERGNRPGGPADTSTQYVPGSTRLESRPLTPYSMAGPGGATLSREGGVESLERDVWRAYVEAGYRVDATVEDGLRKLEDARRASGQSLRELRIAQGLEPRKDPDVLRDEALNFIIGPYLASRLPGGNPTKQDFDPLWDSIDVLGVLPFGRIGKTAALGARGLTAARAGSNIIDAVRDASVAYDAGKRFPDLVPAARTLTARVTDPATGALKQASVEVGAPRSILGRTVVAGFDKTREAASKIPGLPDFQARRVFREIAARERNTSLLERAPASALKKTANPKRTWLRLTSGQQYALKLVAEGPEVEYHVAFRTELRDEALAAYQAAKAAGDGAGMRAAQLDAMVQDIHLAGLEDAVKYVVPDGTGGLRLADNAPAQMKKAWDLMLESGTRREDIVRTLDEAIKGHVEDNFAERLQKPGRVVKGARWYDEAQARADIKGALGERKGQRRWFTSEANTERATLRRQLKDATVRAERAGRESERLQTSMTPGERAADVFERAANRAATKRSDEAFRILQQIETKTIQLDRLRDRLETETLKYMYATERTAARTNDAALTAKRLGVFTKGDEVVTKHGPGYFVSEVARKSDQRGGYARVIVRGKGAYDVPISGIVHATDVSESARKVANPSSAKVRDLVRQIQAFERELKDLGASQKRLRRAGEQPAVLQFIAEQRRIAAQAAAAGRARTARVSELAAQGTMRALDDALGALDTRLTETLARVDTQTAEAIKAIRGKVDTLVGFEDYAGGKTFIPSVRGIPGTVVDRIRIYAAVRSSPGPGSAMGAGPTKSAGANLKKAFKGDSVISGLVRTDAANLSAESLVNASRLSAFKRMRDELLKIATDTPTHPDDIAIRVDLTKTTDPKLRTATDLLDNLENATDESLSVIGEADTQGLLETMFPRAFEDVQNIKWVSRNAVDATGLLDVRDAALKATSAWKKLGRAAAGLPVDALNDINKAIVLYLNPAYPVVQFLGNSTMGLMQQGVFYPANLAKAWALHWKMDDVARAALDDLIGVSATNAAAEHGTIKSITGGMADFESMLADLGPRRAAWLHEARREGYTTIKQVEDLLKNYKGREDVIHKITERGKDAIGNFDRMTPIEKKIVTRIFWFYPWTRAAARWSVLHTLEHPYQAAAIAYGYDKQQEIADREIGERPWYMHFAIVTGHDKQGRPIVVNPTQWFPQTSAIEVPFLIYSFATQQNPRAWPSPVDRFTPALGAAFDAVKDNDVSKLFASTGDRFQPLNIYNRLSRSPEQVAADDKRKAQPRSETGEILRTFFGSGQVPASVNTDVVNKMVAGKKSADDKVRDKVDKLAEESGKTPPSWYVEAEKKRQDVNDLAEMVRERMREELGTDDLSDAEMNQARVEALAQVAFGENSPQVAKMVRIARSPAAARNLIRTLEARLGFTRASGYKRVVSR